jgi:hypothetical protein
VEYVRAEAVRWVDEEFPGWVEVRIAEHDGAEAIVVDKAPVFDNADRLLPGVEFPVELELPCDVLRWEPSQHHGRSAVVVLHHHIEDQAGRTEFRVSHTQIIERP